MKLRIEPGAFLFRLSVEDARELRDGQHLRHEIELLGGSKLHWSADTTSGMSPKLNGLDLIIPRTFIDQELAMPRPSKEGLVFTSGANRVGVQIDMRKPKKAGVLAP